MKIQEAVILAGGLGTRLRSVVKEIPKPMAPVNDIPFLAYLLHYLKKYNVNRVILSVGYKYEVIEDFFGKEYKGIELVYALECTPLGTGGGIKNALSYARDKDVYLLNGDTFFEVDLNELSHQFFDKKAPLCLSLKEMFDFDRYGVVTFEDEKVTGFKDKEYCKKAWINGGVYALKTDIFSTLPFEEKFSFETDFMESYFERLAFFVFLSRSYFIDIGIPEDFERAQKEFQTMPLFKTGF